MNNTWHQQIMRVQYKDTDQMGVVHHANYVSLFEVGRTEWMRNAGFAYSKMESMGLLLPVVDLNLNYLKPGRYDDVIAIFTKVSQFSKVRLQFDYEARRIGDASSFSTQLPPSGQIDTPHGELLASGTTLHTWVNLEWKPVRIDRVAPEVYALLQSEEFLK
ncbi:acyl-CoA thioesterase [Oceanobacillus longus]|uniref:Acyl-CoA thioesterase n=1 Tax=Oceanobacillus longus TaxID=930120 RepID=A0ABV8GZQ9_9BACI